MAALTLVSILIVAASSDLAKDDAAVSLLQLTASKKRGLGIGSDLSEEDAQTWWGGKPFFVCEQVKLGFRSNCAGIASKEVVEWASRATNSPRDCGIVANRTGADTFNFDMGRVCEPLKCRNADVRPVAPGKPEEHLIGNHTNITIFSSFCGLEWVTKTFTSNTCGKGKPIGLGYHKFQDPPSKACENTLNFSNGVSSNELQTGGALVYANVLPDTDLMVTADNFKSPRRDRTGEKNGFAILNLKTGTNSNFTFTFKKHATNESVIVEDFILTLAALSTSQKCWNKLYATAEGFTGYFLSSTPKLDVKVFPGNEEAPPNVTFMSSHMEWSKLKNANITSVKLLDMSASLYYRSTDHFKLKVETLDEKWKSGARLYLGGQSLVTCQGR
jgi:hypothetical protein